MSDIPIDVLNMADAATLSAAGTAEYFYVVQNGAARRISQAALRRLAWGAQEMVWSFTGGNLVVTSTSPRFRARGDGTFVHSSITAGSPSTSGAVVVAVYLNGIGVFSETLAQGSSSTASARLIPVSDGDLVECLVTQAGTGAADVVVQVLKV